MVDSQPRDNAPEDGVEDTPVRPASSKLSPDDPFALDVQIGLRAAFARAGLLSRDQVQSLPTPVPLMVALSGGPDSTALLAACTALKNEMRLEISACHVNHHLRGSESNQDEAHCHALCKDWHVPLTVKQIIPRWHKRPGEAALRAMRYKLLAEAARQVDVRFIALAHTLNDQVETLLFRLFRGTGLAGLAGMDVARRLEPGTILIRPLLTVTHEKCLQYLQRNGIEARLDSSNLDLYQARNYIRQAIIPAIEERFPSFMEKIDQLRQRINAEESFLDRLAEEAIDQLQGQGSLSANRWDLHAFRCLPRAIQARLVSWALKQREVEVTFQRVTSILELIDQARSERSRLSLNRRWDVRANGSLITWIDKEGEEKSGLMTELEQSVKMPGLTTIPLIGQALRIERWSGVFGEKVKFPAPTDFEALVDLSRVKLPLVVRGRRSGDQIRPFGMDELVRLKKYLHNRKPPSSASPERNALFLLADQEEVLWVPGVGLSHKIRVENAPSHRLSWVPLAPDETYFS